MTPRIVQGWNPLGRRRPTTDDQLFELLTATVFQARFRPDIVQQRWPSIRRAFAGFQLETVARWEDERVTELLQYPGMIRSPKKLRATLRNARDLQERSRRFGGARRYLDSYRAHGDDEALVRELDTWAHYIGAPSIRWFVMNLGPVRRSAASTRSPAGTR